MDGGALATDCVRMSDIPICNQIELATIAVTMRNRGPHFGKLPFENKAYPRTHAVIRHNQVKVVGPITYRMNWNLLVSVAFGQMICMMPMPSRANVIVHSNSRFLQCRPGSSVTDWSAS